MSRSVARFGEPRAAAMARRFLGLVAVVCAVFPAALSAAALGDADKREVRQVVEAQLKAFVQDHAGRLWIAIDLLQRQAGAGWRISGCVVVPDSEILST